MAILLGTIQIARGVLANRPVTGLQGEPYFATDSERLYVYWSGSWVAISGGSAALASLTDVQISSPVAGQTLKYSSILQKWVNETDTGSGALAGLTDCAITSPTDGQVLTYDSIHGLWENQTSSGGSGGAPTGSNIALLPALSNSQSYANGAVANTVGWGGYSFLTGFQGSFIVNVGSKFKINLMAALLGGQSAPAWQPFTEYFTGSLVTDSNGNIQYAEAPYGGISGATHPVWNTNFAGTTQDGNASTGLSWKNYGPYTGLKISSAVLQTWSRHNNPSNQFFVSSVPVTWNGGNASPSLAQGQNLSDSITCDISAAFSYQLVVYFATAGTNPLSGLFQTFSGITNGSSLPNWPTQNSLAGDWTNYESFPESLSYFSPTSGGIYESGNMYFVGLEGFFTA